MLDLFSNPEIVVQPNHAPGLTNEERFKAFHAANPHVYKALVKLALDLKAKGRTLYGIGTLFEVVRWHYHMTTKDDADFKINNNHKPYYARLIMLKESDLKDFFKIRDQWATQKAAKDGPRKDLN